jgi:large subunit ribosomal protein L31
MQKDIHPKYIETDVECSCGNAFVTRSTVKTLKIDICSSCHPFYTGTMKFVDSAGRVEKFQKKYDWANRKKS